MVRLRSDVGDGVEAKSGAAPSTGTARFGSDPLMRSEACGLLLWRLWRRPFGVELSGVGAVADGAAINEDCDRAGWLDEVWAVAGCGWAERRERRMSRCSASIWVTTCSILAVTRSHTCNSIVSQEGG